jgi:hypothetical protein
MRIDDGIGRTNEEWRKKDAASINVQRSRDSERNACRTTTPTVTENIDQHLIRTHAQLTCVCKLRILVFSSMRHALGQSVARDRRRLISRLLLDQC